MNKVFGLIGKNIRYSYSPLLFKQIFKKHGWSARYDLFDLNDIAEVENLMQNEYLAGFNVTIPYKKVIMEWLDDISLEAKHVNAVNTVKKENNRWIGYNTDIYGFEKSLNDFINQHIQKAVILGNGATARTIKYVLQQNGIRFITLSRTKTENTWLYKEFSSEALQEIPLIINTTPLGNKNHPTLKPPLPYEGIGPRHYLFDLNYNPPITPFLMEGLKRGAQVKNGMAMLIYQAEKTFEIWRSPTPG